MTNRPESVTLAVKVWLGIILAEVLHQVLVFLQTLTDDAARAALAKRTREWISRPQPAGGAPAADAANGVLDDAALHAATTTSLVLALGIALLIQVVLLLSVRKLSTRPGVSDGARRLLAVFSMYYGFRMIIVFATPAGAQLAFTLVDGSLQILIGVAGFVAATLLLRVESVQWAVGHSPDRAPR